MLRNCPLTLFAELLYLVIAPNAVPFYNFNVTTLPFIHDDI